LERYRENQLPADIDPSKISKRLLELGYEANPQRFSLEKCEILSPLAAAAAATSDLRVCNQPSLPFALTTNIAMDEAQAVFSQIQSYLQRTAGWEQNALDLITRGFNSPEQQDEIFCELMMQLMVS
jgi:hypothetical protein